MVVHKEGSGVKGLVMIEMIEVEVEVEGGVEWSGVGWSEVRW